MIGEAANIPPEICGKFHCRLVGLYSFSFCRFSVRIYRPPIIDFSLTSPSSSANNFISSYFMFMMVYSEEKSCEAFSPIPFNELPDSTSFTGRFTDIVTVSV